MRTYYELLSVVPTAAPDEIKSAFRREIARYHPDKVQHLGPEFQEIAATRAAELTEAYRVLMDAAARQRYDEGLQEETDERPATPPRKAAPPPATSSRPPHEEHPRATDREFRRERAAVNQLVERAILGRVRAAMDIVASDAASISTSGFDLAFGVKGKGGLFKKAAPAMRLFARVVPQADATAVEECWPLALKAGGGEVTCVLLLGAGGMAPAKELAAAVSEQRRKSRAGCGPIMVPVDVRDWEALFPPDAPGVVRLLVQRLREGTS